MQSRRLPLALLTVALALVAASCGAMQGASPALAPSRTPEPTFTPTAAVTPLPLFTPTQAPAPAITATAAVTVPLAVAPTITATAAVTVPVALAPTITATAAVTVPVASAPTAPQFTADDSVNVRQGPGTNYDLMGQVQPQTSYKLLAKNQDASWLEFNYNGDPGWVSASLVNTTGDLSSVQVAQNLPESAAQPVAQAQQPATPVPAAPPPAAPTAAPAPAPAAPAPAPASSNNWLLVSSGTSAPQCGNVYFNGQVQYANGSPQNGVCVYLDYYGPRTIKYSGSGGAGNGNWGFSPCAQNQSCSGPFVIYIVQCPPNMPNDGLNLPAGSTPPPPASSDKFTATVTNKCTTGQWTGIVFKSAQ